MTLLLWLVPLGLVALTLIAVLVGWVVSGASEDSSGWSLGSDGSRVVGSLVIALGLSAAGFIGVGDHRLPTVLAGNAPFAWGPAIAVSALSLLVGGALLLSGRREEPS